MAITGFFNKAVSWTKLFRFGDNVKPNRIKMKQSANRTDVFHTSKGHSGHGHSVVNNGNLDYSRTEKGNVVKDSNSGGGCAGCPYR